MLPSSLHEPEYSHGASEPFAPGVQVDDQHPIDFAIGEAGLRVKLQGSNPELLMSALGQKRTLKRGHPMSSLPPKADIQESPRSSRWISSVWMLLHRTCEDCSA